MRWKALSAVLALAFVLPAAPAAARHWGGGRGSHFYGPYSHYSWSVGIGLGWGWGPGWGGWGPPVVYEPVPATAARTNLTAVDTDVSPEHARVILNGELIGVADDFDGYPDYLYLEPGHYTITLQLQGYTSQKVEVDATPGRYVPIKLKLERIPGEKAAPWYDRPQGLPIGRVFGPEQTGQEGAGKAGADTSLRPEFQPPRPAARGSTRAGEWSALDLRVAPPNAAVYVDGAMVGTAQELGRLERGLAVRPGKHQIEVLAPGYGAKNVAVDVQQGQRQQVVIELSAGTGQSQ
jgi:3D (Asp-Asp-Asp) domain-containing protein